MLSVKRKTFKVDYLLGVGRRRKKDKSLSKRRRRQRMRDRDWEIEKQDSFFAYVYTSDELVIE